MQYLVTLQLKVILLTIGLVYNVGLLNDIPCRSDFINKVVIPSNLTSKEEAFNILNQKCNVCHIKKNKKRLFTFNNMDNMSKDIYKQVFVKKRMPKGKDNRLTSEEYASLLTWISTIKNK